MQQVSRARRKDILQEAYGYQMFASTWLQNHPSQFVPNTKFFQHSTPFEEYVMYSVRVLMHMITSILYDELAIIWQLIYDNIMHVSCISWSIPKGWIPMCQMSPVMLWLDTVCNTGDNLYWSPSTSRSYPLLMTTYILQCSCVFLNCLEHIFSNSLAICCTGFIIPIHVGFKSFS